MGLVFHGPITLCFWLSASPFPTPLLCPAVGQQWPFLTLVRTHWADICGVPATCQALCRGWRLNQEKGTMFCHHTTCNLTVRGSCIFLGVGWYGLLKNTVLNLRILVISDLLSFISLGSAIQFMCIYCLEYTSRMMVELGIFRSSVYVACLLESPWLWVDFETSLCVWWALEWGPLGLCVG